MSNRVLIPVALIVGLAAGLLLGLTLGDGPAAPDRPAPAAEGDADAGPARTGAERVERTPRAAAGSRLGAPETAGAPATWSGGSKIDLAALDPVPAPAGDGRIEGTARTPAGDPVAGVIVRATPKEDRDDDDLATPGEVPPSDLPTLVRRYAEKTLVRLSTQCEARTAADGTYVLQGLGEGAYRVAAYLGDHAVSAAAPSRHEHARAGDRIDFVVNPLIDVVLTIRTEAGAVPQRARVGVGGGRTDDAQVQLWSPAEPAVRLPPGSHELTAVAGTFEELRSEPTRIDVATGMEAAQIVLLERPGIAGHVRPAPGDDSLEGGSVHLLRFSGGEPPSPERVEADGESAWVAVYDDYRFVFRDLAPGTYRIGANRQGAPLTRVETVQVGDGLLVHDVTFAPVRREDYLVLRVLGPDGEPLTDVDIGTGFATHAFSSQTSGGSHDLLPDRSYRVFHHDVDPAYRGLDDNKYFVIVTSERYGQREVEYALGPATELTIRFAEPAVLVVRVTGVRPDLVDRTRVIIEAVTAEDDHAPGVALHGIGTFESGVESTGLARFEKLPAGRYEVRVTVGGHEVARTLAVAAPGESSTQVAMPALHSLTVSADAGAGAAVWIERQAAEGGPRRAAHQPLDAEGRYTWRFLPPGTYEVRLLPGEGGEPASKTVTLPGPAEVRFP